MKPILMEEDAEREFLASVDFYEGRRAGLGLEFEHAVHEALDLNSIQAAPER